MLFRSSKSASSENTYAEDLRDAERIAEELRRMAAELAEWLERKALEARTVTVKVRYDDFSTVTRSHSLSQPTQDAARIGAWAIELLKRTEAGDRPVRLLGVRVHGFQERR